MTIAELAKMARMATYLQPSQPLHRVRLCAQRAALARWPAAGQRLLTSPRPAGAPTPGWPPGFQPVDAGTAASLPGPDGLRAGRVSLLGMTRDLGSPPDWRQRDAPLLWRFHLHYWDWAWALTVDSDRVAARDVFARLWLSWQAACPFGTGEAWHPYPTAVRAWSWCGLFAGLVAGTGLEKSFVAGLAAHAGFLRRHLERDVGGNHLIRNLKALAGLAVFSGDGRLLDQTLARLTRQVAVQVLPDGGHYERAPAYHCQVLADLIDIDGLLRASGAGHVPAICAAIARMRRWLGAVLTPAGEVPLLNDGFPVSRALLAELRPELPPAVPLLTLPDTGLVRASAGGWQLLADAGPPCPDEVPAHAHADTLHCLLHADGAPLLVDTGTSTYDRGPARDYERSTSAHNTLEVDGTSSTEVWGAFRAARRARVLALSARSGPAGVVVEAAHDGFRRLGGAPVHRRRWTLAASGLRVEDLVTGRGTHAIVIHWHLAPGSQVRLGPAQATVTTPAGTFRVEVAGSPHPHLSCRPGPVAAGFGRTVPAPVLTCSLAARLPARVVTSWRRARPAAEEGI